MKIVSAVLLAIVAVLLLVHQVASEEHEERGRGQGDPSCINGKRRGFVREVNPRTRRVKYVPAFVGNC